MGAHASRSRGGWPMVTGIGSSTWTEDSLFVSRSFAAVLGVGALSLLLTSCADAPTSTSPTTAVSVTPARGVVLSADLDAATRARYERALTSLGAPAVTVDAVVPGEGAVALGLPVPGADGIVTMDLDAAGRMAARRLARCLDAVGVTSGPVVLDASLPSARSEIGDRGYEAVVTGESFDVVYANREGDVIGVVTASAAAIGQVIDVLDTNAQAVKVPVVSVGVDDTTATHLDDGTLCDAARPAFRAEARAAVELAAGLASGDSVGDVPAQRVEIDGRSIPAVFVKPTLLTTSAAGD